MVLDAFHAPANHTHVLFHDVLGALDVNELLVVREQQCGMLLLRLAMAFTAPRRSITAGSSTLTR